MALAAYQQCSSLNGWVPVEVDSRTKVGVTYLVLTSPWGDPEENICECASYTYRGQCAHQRIAHGQLCRWSEIALRARQQTDSDRRLMVCPECGHRTTWAFKRLQAGDQVAEEGH